MAIVGDRRKRFQKEIDKLEAQQDTAAKMVSTHTDKLTYKIEIRLYRQQSTHTWPLWYFVFYFNIVINSLCRKYCKIPNILCTDSPKLFHQ